MTKEKWDIRLETETSIREAFPNGELIPIKSVADWLGVSVKSLHTGGKFPIRKVGGRYFVTRKELARWMS